MNKKIFQLFFFLIIVAAFGVIIKNYVNSIVSNIEDYRLVLDKVTEGEISRLSPITFHLAQNIQDEKYQMNVPIKNDLVKFRPAIKGYIYFTDHRTIEFQPDEPLESGITYSGKLDVKKLFPTTDLKSFHFKLSTPNISFKIKIKELVYPNTLENQSPIINGYITFNDYIDYDKRQNILIASQNSKPLSIDFSPSKNNQSFEFKITGIQRTNKNEKVELFWSGKSINSKTKDSTSVIIASKQFFNVVKCNFNYFPKPILTIQFTDPIKRDIQINSLLSISNLSNYTIDIVGNELKIHFNEVTENNHTLTLSKNLVSANNSKLHDDYKYDFKLSEPKPIIELVYNSHFISAGKSQNSIDVKVLNLRAINVEITHVADKNMMQFLQVNDLETSLEIERVGKTIFKKTFDVSAELDFNPNELISYGLNLLGADFSKNGLYCFTFSYKPSDIIYNKPDITDPNALDDENNLSTQIKHNIIFSNLLAVAKLTSRDSLYIFVSDLNTGVPIENSSIEIFDFQQNKLASLFTNSTGVARIKISRQNLFVKVQNNTDITYIKIDFENTFSINNSENDGILPINGVLCHIEGLKDTYSPSESMQIGIVIKENGQYNFNKEHLEVKLESPDHFFFNTEISPIHSSDLKLYSTKLPDKCITGDWNLVISTDMAEFNYPFHVVNEAKLMLPIQFSLNEKKKTLDIVAIKPQSIIKNKTIITQIAEYRNPQKKKVPNYLIQNTVANHTPMYAEYKTKFDKAGKSKLNLPAWIKPGMQFQISSKVEFPDDIILEKDTLLSFEENENWPKMNQQWQSNESPTIEKKNVLKNNFNNLNIHLDKNEYVTGDTCHITYSGKVSDKALLTLENCSQIFFSQWINALPNSKKISIIITDKMLPGFYVSTINFHSKNSIPSYEYISVTNINSKKQFEVKATIPKEGSTDKKLPILVENSGKSDINYILSISNNLNSSNLSNSIYNYFTQKQQNNINNWGSLQLPKQNVNAENSNALIKLNSASFDDFMGATANLETEFIFGSFKLSGETKETQYIDLLDSHPLNVIKIIGIYVQTGEIFELTHEVKITNPITLKTHIPSYLNSEDVIEIPIELKNTKFGNDMLSLNILDIKNLDPINSMQNDANIFNNKPALFTVAFKAKKIRDVGEFQIAIKNNANPINYDISIPILSNPTKITKSESAAIPPQNEWQQIITPIGIKETNKALLEISNSEIPNIWQILQNLDNINENIVNVIDKTFPLIFLNNLLDNTELKQKNSDQIKSVIQQLPKYQTPNGGFAFQTNNTEPVAWLTCYIGEFMLIASKNDYKINEGTLNKWKRFQQIELQRIKYAQQTNYISSSYLIYTLSLANAIKINQLSEFNSQTKNRLIDRIYLANAYTNLGNVKMAKAVINIDIIKSSINPIDITECAVFLNLSHNLKNTELSTKLKSQLNLLILNESNSPHSVSMALNSILNSLSFERSPSNIQLKYQINNGKDIFYNTTSTLSYIEIPLDFTLSKNIDIYNIGDKMVYVNLSHAGNPQEYTYEGVKNNNLQITNKYFTLENNLLNTKKITLEDYCKQVITLKNLNSLSFQNLSVSIPIPAGVELIYSNTSVSTDGKPFMLGVLQTQISLKPLEIYEFVLIYKPLFKGQFVSFPITTLNNDIYNNRTYTQQSNFTIY